jgi:DNA-binding IscR family transcriptional regulator
MSLSPKTVLVAVTELAEEPGETVTETALAEYLGVPESALADPLDSLRECELLKTTDDGYRTTITGRELLALDVELGDVLVVDIVDEC